MTKTHQPGKKPAFKAGAELRARLLEAARRLFGEAGYENVSMRKIAEEAGCSLMASYRHFPDKNALIRQLCIDLYERFTLQTQNKLDQISDPRERLKEAMRRFIALALANPHHYRLTFTTPALDPQAEELRTKAASPTLDSFRRDLKLALPPDTSDAVAEERFQQIIACLHGMAIILTTQPRTYGITKQSAVRVLEAALDRLLQL